MFLKYFESSEQMNKFIHATLVAAGHVHDGLILTGAVRIVAYDFTFGSEGGGFG